jgi:glucosylceramidase
MMRSLSVGLPLALLDVIVLGGCSSAGGTSPPSQELPPDSGAVVPDSGTADVATQDVSTPPVDEGGAEASPPEAAAPPPPPAAYVTTDDLSQGLASTPVILGAGDASPAATVTVDPTTKYQTIVGFGASITDSSSYVMTRYLSPTALTALLVKLFDPDKGVGISFLRQPMGASDFSSVGNFSYDDGNSDPTLANFNITQDLKATVPVLKQVLAIAPGIFILGTPWSPPAWMKLNASMDGSGGAAGNPGLSTGDYGALATYFVKYVQAYAKEGVVVGAVTPQNEPLNGTANYPGMSLTAPSELQLIAANMGPAFQQASLTTEIWAYDHNWDTESYPASIMADATAASFTEGAAFHCYGGDPSAMTTFHAKYPQKSVYMTECSGGTWQCDPFANTIDLAIDSTNNWARAVVLWNMALDENMGPQNHGCPTCRGVVTVNSGTGQVTYNADYYALGHFTKFVRPGATRIGSKTSNMNLNQVAFANTDGSVAFVAHNTGGTSLTVQVGTGPQAMTVSIPANAAVTLFWTP